MHDGELLGALSITKKRGDAVTPTEDTLVGNLAAQAGLVLRNVGLTEQLLARLAELRTSRERLVTAQDRERQRLERDIRDGAQRQLVGLASKLGLAARAMEHDEAQAKALLNQVTSHTAQALKDLRELARGIYPALLADMGVGAALDAQARKAPIPVSVEAGGIGRYPQETEAAVYFCALEALRNAAKHAHASRASVRLSESNAELAVRSHRQRPGIRPRYPAAGHRPAGHGRPDRRTRRPRPHRLSSRPGHQDQRPGTRQRHQLTSSRANPNGRANSPTARKDCPMRSYYQPPTSAIRLESGVGRPCAWPHRSPRSGTAQAGRAGNQVATHIGG